jgi:hypothetical protein
MGLSSQDDPTCHSSPDQDTQRRDDPDPRAETATRIGPMRSPPEEDGTDDERPKPDAVTGRVETGSGVNQPETRGTTVETRAALNERSAQARRRNTQRRTAASAYHARPKTSGPTMSQAPPIRGKISQSPLISDASRGQPQTAANTSTETKTTASPTSGPRTSAHHAAINERRQLG